MLTLYMPSKKLSFLFGSFLLLSNYVTLHPACADVASDLDLRSLTVSALTRPAVPETHLLPSLKGLAQGKTSIQRKKGFVSNLEQNFQTTLQTVYIQGATIYSTADLSKSFAPLIGKVVSVKDLEKVIDKIIERYVKDGYPLATATLNLHETEDGSLELKIEEGRVVSVRIEDGLGPARAIVEEYVAKIKNARPFNLDIVKLCILRASQTPGVAIESIIIPSEAEDSAGTGEVVFRGEYRKYRANATVDNYGSRYEGPVRAGVTGYVGSILQEGDDTEANAWFTPGTRELRYGRLSHTALLGHGGAVLRLTGEYGKTHPGFILKPFNVKGEYDAFSALLIYPILLTTTQSLSIKAGLNMLYNAADSNVGRLFKDKIRNVVIGATYGFQDGLNGLVALSGDIEQGVDIFGASHKGDATLSRPKGEEKYTKGELAISRLQSLPWQLSLLTAIKSQYSNDRLLSFPQFGFGGYNFGKGYDFREISGDSGLGGRAEFRFDTSPELTLVNHAQFFVFYDVGRVWNNDKVNFYAHKSIASTGLGCRINFINNLYGSFDLAKPLTRKVTTETLAGKNGRPLRFLFKITLQM